MIAVTQKVDASRTETSLSNEKLSRLVDILKNIAGEQDKFAQILGNQNMINKNIQSAADDIQKAITSNSEQGRFSQLLGNQDKINRNIQTVAENIQNTVSGSNQQLASSLTEAHKEFRDRLEDLRRKSNVAIARNNDILKLLKR